MDLMSMVSVALLLASVILIGNAAVTALRMSWAYCIPLGLGVLAITLTFALITSDASLAVAQIAVGAVTIASLYYSSALAANRRALMQTLGVVAATYGIILIPAIVGGPQFYVFRGNWWDHFNYIAGMEAISLYRASALRHLTATLVTTDPISLYGAPGIALRPAAVLIAAVYRLPGADVFAYAYSYLAVLLSLLAAVIVARLKELRDPVNRRALSVLIGISVVVGFWGQLLLDTSVWSHIACLPLLASLFYDGLIRPTQAAGEATIRDRAAKLVLFLAAFIIYPEATVVVVVLLILADLLSTRSLARQLPDTILFAAAIVLAAIVDYTGSVRFFADQLAFGVSKAQGASSWFLYTLQPYFGYNFTDIFRNNIDELKGITQQGGPVALVRTVVSAHPMTALLPANLVPILFGFYPVIAALASYSIALSVFASGLLILSLGILVVRIAGGWRSDEHNRAFMSVLPPFALMVFTFVLLGKIWEIGKAFTFVIPLLLPVFYVLALRLRRGGASSLALAVTLLFVISSAGFATARMWLARSTAGIGHRSPFPSVIRTDDKVYFRYALPTALRRCSGTAVAETHPNRALYLLIGARQYSAAWFDKPFTYYGYGLTTYQPPPGRIAACSIRFTGQTLQTGRSKSRVSLGVS
jgi:hypothetical protein